MVKTRIVIADDHALFREGLRSLIEMQADMEVVGEAANSSLAVSLSNELQPDVVILDISMPGPGGIDASRQIRRQSPNIRILILSMHSRWNYITALLNIGISGYFLKTDSFAAIAGAIRGNNSGDVYLSPEIKEILIERCFKKGANDKFNSSGLDSRQREILRLLAEGKSAGQIAGRFNISRKSVEFQRRTLMSRLEIRNTADLVKYALKEGFISME